MPTEHRVRRWLRDAHVDAISGVLVAAFVVLRLVATIGRPTVVFNDTASYFDFRVWGAVRFPVVTAFYAIVGDHRAIADVQSVTGALAWAVAALVAASVLDRRWVRGAFLALVLLLGLTAPVTRVDNALLSESVAISLTVVLVACVLRYACRPTRAMAIAVLAVGVTWALARQNHSFLLVVGAVVLAALGAGRADRRLAWPLAAGLLLVAAVGVVLASSTSQIQEYNSGQILVRRVLQDDAREQWFLDHGMPDNGDELIVPPYENRFGDPAVELQEDPVFGPWLRDDFPRRYLRYLVTHPAYTFGTPFGAEGALVPFAVGTTGYGNARQVLPGADQSVFWPQTAGDRRLAGDVALVILGLGVAAAFRGRPGRRALAGVGGVLLVAAANVVFVTHTAGWEYERLLVPTGVAVRFALVWLLATVVGGVSAAPPASAGPASRSRRRDATSTGREASPAPRTPDDPGSPDILATTAGDPPSA